MDFAALSLKLPTGHDPDSKERRKALFRKCDVNGNGYLSLAEVDKAVGEAIGDEYLFSAKPVIAQAFAAAKDMRSGKSPDYVERSEFRLLLVYLRQYFELYVAYNRLDSSDDRRLSLPEFRKGVGLLAQWGIDLDEGEVEAEFARIDVNGGGIVLFDEFCDCKHARSPRVRPLSARARALHACARACAHFLAALALTPSRTASPGFGPAASIALTRATPPLSPPPPPHPPMQCAPRVGQGPSVGT